MSSNDDMSTVFKCLSKGAVDFLVKPIRKNELKNLWQHVWRRCHSVSCRSGFCITCFGKSVTCNYCLSNSVIFFYFYMLSLYYFVLGLCGYSNLYLLVGIQSSGSGSESGIQTQKGVKSKSGDESDNNSGSNGDDGDDASMGLNARNGSDNGSGTQV
jgi:pseudo-response regulator 7